MTPPTSPVPQTGDAAILDGRACRIVSIAPPPHKLGDTGPGIPRAVLQAVTDDADEATPETSICLAHELMWLAPVRAWTLPGRLGLDKQAAVPTDAAPAPTPTEEA